MSGEQRQKRHKDEQIEEIKEKSEQGSGPSVEHMWTVLSKAEIEKSLCHAFWAACLQELSLILVSLLV